MREAPTAGIYISRTTQMHSNTRTVSGNSMTVLRCVYFYLCLAGTVLTVKEAVRVNFRTDAVLGMLLVFCALLQIRQLKVFERIPRFRQALSVGLLVGAASAGIFLRERLFSGYLVMENGIRAQLQEYYGVTLAQKTVPLPKEKGEVFLIFFFGLLIFSLGDLVVRRGRIAFLILVQTLFLVLELLCGCRFQEPGFYLVMGGLLALYVMGSRRGGRNKGMLLHPGLWGGILILLIFSVSGTVLAPKLYKKAYTWNEKLYSLVQETLGKINVAVSSRNGIFGNHTPTADGSLNNYQVRQNGETDLVVSLPKKPENSIYLRGFIGDTYEGTYWHGADEEQFAAAFPEKDAEYQVQNFLYQYISGRAETSPGTIRVERVRPGGEYGYVPYGYETPNDVNLQGDSSYTSAEDRMQYQGYADWKQWLEEEPGESRSELEARYEQYVADQYLKIPVKGLGRLKEYCAQYDFQSVQEVIDFVVPAVQEGRPYSMDLKSVSPGKDFAEYFFFDQKKGYCIHYATTAVLMFRLMGVPARYVTGYVVQPDLFVQNSAGYIASVPDTQAHAWAEVYRSGKGWIPVEVTPGYSMENGSESAVDRIPEETEQEPTPQSTPTSQSTPTPQPDETPEMQPEEPDIEEPADPEESTEAGSEGESEAGDESESSQAVMQVLRVIGKILLIIVGAAAFLAAGIVGILWNRRRIREKRKRLFFQKDRNKGAQEISYQLYRMLQDAGIKEELGNGKSPDLSYARRIEERLKELDEGAYAAFIRLVQKAAYGKEQISRQELQECMKVYHRIASILWKRMDRRKKLWWKYMKCYEIS